MLGLERSEWDGVVLEYNRTQLTFRTVVAEQKGCLWNSIKGCTRQASRNKPLLEESQESSNSSDSEDVLTSSSSSQIIKIDVPRVPAGVLYPKQTSRSF
ncbi:hypothetical protein KOW79_014008 [Hemibagrus wyckioides]|uniref:Uncharacterized protein n=1 Tax=Hemibagrus wyckioides TaxID=337641 RepID=A0A9D3NI01_9TELE|nr:hypothetical protein KOW79_014008 [Hemibagrus wyckioides]